jgi:hypothetical protein
MTTTTNPAKPHDTSGTPSGSSYLDTSSKTSVDGQLNATLENGACEFNDLEVVEEGKEEVLEERNWGNSFSISILSTFISNNRQVGCFSVT